MFFFSPFKVRASGPKITNITTSATTLKLSWNLNSTNLNGKITEYEVCYLRGSGVPNCSWSESVTGVDNTTTTLSGLRPATKYTVAVRAYNSSGPGNLGEEKTFTTKESGEFLKNIFKDFIVCDKVDR